jgi:hypothetical protein
LKVLVDFENDDHQFAPDPDRNRTDNDVNKARDEFCESETCVTTEHGIQPIANTGQQKNPVNKSDDLGCDHRVEKKEFIVHCRSVLMISQFQE